MKATELRWGLKQDHIQGGALWGARMILSEHPPSLDILWDRQELAGLERDRHELLRRLNGGALDSLRKAVASGKLRFLQDNLTEVWSARGVEFHASTQRSFGYLYVTARLVAESKARAVAS